MPDRWAWSAHVKVTVTAVLFQPAPFFAGSGLAVIVTSPSELHAKLEPAEVYHEVLEHRWFLSEQSGAEVPIQKAAETYINTVLRRLPDEEVALSALESMGPLANPFDPSQGFADEEYEKPYDPWEDGEEVAGADEEHREPNYLDIAALRAKAKK